MPVEFLTPSDLDYSKLSVPYTGEQNFVRFQPVSGETYRSGNSFKIIVNSDDEFVDVTKSYLKFNVALTGGATTSGNCLTSLGGASTIARLTTSVGGRVIEDLNRYNTYVSALYKRAPTTYQNMLKQLELYNNQTALTSSANAYANGATVCHSLRCALFESDQKIPVVFFQGGFSIEATLEDYRNVLATAANGTTDFVISNVELVCCMIKPSASFIKGFQDSLSAGREATIPLTVTRNYRLNPSTTSTDATIQVQIGWQDSLRSILGVRKLQSNYNNTSVDYFNVDSLCGLKRYYFQIGSQRFPKNKEIGCNNSTSSGAVDPENLMFQMVSLDNTYPHLNAVQHADTDTGELIYYNFATSRNWGTGIPVDNGTITINLSHNSAPSASDLDLFLAIDGLLTIRNAEIDFSTTDIVVGA